MASHTRFWIIAFTYLLATQSSEAMWPFSKSKKSHSAHAPAHSPAHSPGGAPQMQPMGTPEEKNQIKEEIRFLESEKQVWTRMFKNISMPPVVNHSMLFPPPEVLLGGALEMAKRIKSKRPSSFESPEVKNNVLKAIDVPDGGGPMIIDPKIEAKIVKHLKGVMYDESAGIDREADRKVKRFVDFLATGNATGEGAATLDLSKKMSKAEVQSFREQMAIVLAGYVPGENMDPKTDLGPNVGFTRLAPTSTILPIAKATGPQTLDIQVHDKTVESLFFRSRDLNTHKRFKLHFTNSKNYAAFMSSNMMDKSGIMASFVLMDIVSILTESTVKKENASIIPEVDTISICEQPATKGKNKNKVCAINLEQMLNYTMSKLGTNLRSANTWIQPGKTTKIQEYQITKIHKLPAVKIVGCTKMSFSIAVFYCLHLPKTVVYTASLIGEDGTKVRAPILCHEDTTMWNPNSWIFKLLNKRPEPDTKICHFLAADDIAWMNKDEENTVG